VPEEAGRRVKSGEAATIRLKVTGETSNWNDLVHGPTSFSSEVIGDPVLLRSDGPPAYNYAVVIDDHLMEITHVIRGDDHISNTPRQLALYQALGWQPRSLPTSRRFSAPTARVFRSGMAPPHSRTSANGILPEALRKLFGAARLVAGRWHFGDPQRSGTDRPVLSRPDHQSPAVFDLEKLNWLNRHYLRETPQRRLAELSVPYLVRAVLAERWTAVLGVARARAGHRAEDLDQLSQLPAAVKLVFEYERNGRL